MVTASNKSLESITAQPIEVLRRDVAAQFLHKKLDLAAFNQIAPKIETLVESQDRDRVAILQPKLKRPRNHFKLATCLPTPI
jgi:hypothetical protein